MKGYQVVNARAAAALCTLVVQLLATTEPGLGQAPAAGETRAAKAALDKADQDMAGVLTIFNRQGKVVRTVGEPGDYLWPALSPDGDRVAVSRRDQRGDFSDIWVLGRSAGASTRITSESTSERYHTFPVWSPDGSQIVYLAAGSGSPRLYRQIWNGTGDVELLYSHPRPLWVTDWSADGRFLTFYDNSTLYVLPLTSPAPQERKAIEIVGAATDGRFSPDGRFLAYILNQSGRREIWVRSFDSSTVDRSASTADSWRVSEQDGLGMVTWRRDGKELYYLAADGGVMAVEVNTASTFKPGRPRLLFKAPDSVIRDSVWRGPAVSLDGQQFLFNVRPLRGVRYPRQLTVFDRQGNVVRTLGEPGAYTEPVLSPDGTKVAAWLSKGIRVFEVETGASLQVQVAATSNPADSPVWSPDASQLVFFGGRGESSGRYRIASNGQGNTELLDKTEPGIFIQLTDWSPDGRWIAYSEGGVLWAVPVNAERKPIELLREEYSVYGARFSPDSRYLAYVSDESGRNEVYVRPFDSSVGFAPGSPKWQVSNEGGLGLVQWRQDGNELYYLAADGRIMAMEIATSPVFRAGPPKALFRAPSTFTLTSIFNDRTEGTNSPDCSCTSGVGCEQGSISRNGQRFVFAVPMPPNRREIAVAPRILASYVGTYVEGSRNWTVGSGEWTVTLDGNQLIVQRTGQARAPLFAESETRFFLKASNGDFEFVKDDKGEVKYLFMYRGGLPVQAIRRR